MDPIPHEMHGRQEPVVLKEWDTFLGSRSLGARIRGTCDRILAAGDRLVLDWGGVDAASQAFADELVGKLVVALGREEFRRRVRFVHLPESVRPVVRYAIASRLGLVESPREDDGGGPPGEALTTDPGLE